MHLSGQEPSIQPISSRCLSCRLIHGSTQNEILFHAEQLATVLSWFPGEAQRSSLETSEADDLKTLPTSVNPNPDENNQLRKSLRVDAAVLLWGRLVEEEDLDVFVAPLSEQEYRAVH